LKNGNRAQSPHKRVQVRTALHLLGQRAVAQFARSPVLIQDWWI
jgi:hypothetical protein